MNFQKTALFDVLFEDLNRGCSGCFGVMREPDFDNYLALYTQRRRIIVSNLIISLETSTGQRFAFSQRDFRGRFILDGRGEKRERVRFLLLGEDDTPLLASDCDQLHGQIIVLADQAVGEPPKLVGVKAVFGEDEKGPVSTLLWDTSKQLTKLWTLEASLLESEVGGFEKHTVQL